jgi:hypothetical protein
MKQLLSVITVLFLFSCNTPSAKKEDVSTQRLFATSFSPNGGLSHTDTVNGYEVHWNIRDTTESRSYSYTYTKVDTTMRYVGSVTPPPVDTTTPPPVTGYTLNYSNGYDKSTDINSNQLGRGSISTTTFKTGTGSFRSEVRAGDPPISSGWRSEQQYDGTTYNPIEGAVEYDVYYENWKDVSNDGGGHSIQWHPNTGSASAIISLQNYNNKFDVVRSIAGTNYHQNGILRSVVSNKWYHMRWEFKWTTGNGGYVRLFMDNESTPYFSFTGQTADGSGQYLKVGQNRWPWTNGANMGFTTVCYYDNLKIYKKN